MSIEKHFIPLSILNDIRCAQCTKFVTCGPIYVVPNENVLCGRCNLWAKPEYRNHAFEALAQIFWFPCCNWEKQCARKLGWDKSLEHEEHCAYESCCSRFWRRGLCCAGRRDVPIGDIRHTPVPPYLLEQIKCLQCKGYLNCEPVYILTDGSNVCHRCSHANGPPPNSRRNVVYEQLSRILVFPCIFRNRGCPTRLKFGGDLWEHESVCPYNTSYRRQSQTSKKNGQKERGVIATHSGHYYGTITPNSLLFAPPTPNKEVDVNKQIVKSLKKHQERKMMKVDQIESQMSERFSEDGYYDDEKASSIASTTSRSEEDFQQRVSTWQNRDRNSPDNRDSGYQTANRSNPDSFTTKLHDDQSNRLMQSPIHIPRPDYDRENSRASSRTSYTNNIDNNNIITGYYRSSTKPDYIGDINSKNNYTNSKISPDDNENDPVEHFPEYTTKSIDPLAYNPSFRAVNRSESVKSNQELIKELKGKLRKSNSIKNDVESPYVKCKNLEDVLVAHDQIST